MVEGARLEIVWAERSRRFESFHLRQCYECFDIDFGFSGDGVAEFDWGDFADIRTRANRKEGAEVGAGGGFFGFDVCGVF